MGFSSKIKEDALVASGRHCSLCHRFCGTKIEVHHIVLESEGGENIFDNAIPLCFDCHADMRSYDAKHPKGIKYGRNELKRHRDNWYEKVKNNIGVANREEKIETDKKVYEVLVTILPWDGSIQFIRENNFAGFSFETQALKQLYDFLYKCNNPAFEFIDPDLEGLRLSLLENVNLFCTTINLETYPTHRVERNWVPEDWEFEKPDVFWNTVNKLHESARQICDIYDTLIKTATRKIGVIPDKMV